MAPSPAAVWRRRTSTLAAHMSRSGGKPSPTSRWLATSSCVDVTPERARVYGDSVPIRPATDADWPAIYPIFAAIVAEGRTYAYPENLSSEDARDLWMVKPPGRTVVAVEEDDGTILGTATMGPN